MITRFIKWIGRHFGWIVPPAQAGFLPGSDNWNDAQFFIGSQWTEAQAAAIVKNKRLAAIARERTRLKELLEIARRQKKARAHLYGALEALKIEEMTLAGDVR